MASLTFITIVSGHQTDLLIQQCSIYCFDLENMIKAQLESQFVLEPCMYETANFWPSACLQFQDKLAVL